MSDMEYKVREKVADALANIVADADEKDLEDLVVILQRITTKVLLRSMTEKDGGKIRHERCIPYDQVMKGLNKARCVTVSCDTEEEFMSWVEKAKLHADTHPEDKQCNAVCVEMRTYTHAYEQIQDAKMHIDDWEIKQMQLLHAIDCVISKVKADYPAERSASGS